MRRFDTTRQVHHSAENMFALVADVERYPEFVPLCSGLRIIRRSEQDDAEILICDMTAAYKAFSETFRCQVMLKDDHSMIHVKYLDGPFRTLDNIWSFAPTASDQCDVRFFIEYEFRSRALQLVAGAVFDRGFQKFAGAFETRADQVYGTNRQSA